MELDHDSWAGWQIVGRHLITPQRQRVCPHVLQHLVTMHHTRLHFERVGLQAQANAAKAKRRQRAAQPVRVVVVELADWKARHGLGAA